MFFKGIVFDPTHPMTAEFDDYEKFIKVIRSLCVFKINKANPVAEEQTYLWVKIVIAESEEELDTNEAPYFRLNKLLHFGSAPNKPAEIPDTPYLIKHYPSRHTGTLYLTAIANTLEQNCEENIDEISDDMQESSILVLTEKDTRYPTNDPTFDCSLVPNNLINSLKLLLEITHKDNKANLLKQQDYKSALVVSSFYLAEAVRFKLVQYGVMNFLDENNSLAVKTYCRWKAWAPVVLSWKKLCGCLEAGPRSKNPTLLVGIPVNIKIPNRQYYPVQNVLGLFAWKADENELVQKIQEAVLNDYLLRDFAKYLFDDSIFPIDISQELIKDVDFQTIVKDVITAMKTNADSLCKEKQYQMGLSQLLDALNIGNNLLIEENKPLSLSLNYNIGFAHMKLEEYGAAIPYFEKCLEDADPADKRTLILEANLDLCHSQLSHSLR